MSVVGVGWSIYCLLHSGLTGGGGGAGLYSLFSLDVTSLHCSSDVSLDIFNHRNGLSYHV